MSTPERGCEQLRPIGSRRHPCRRNCGRNVGASRDGFQPNFGNGVGRASGVLEEALVDDDSGGAGVGRVDGARGEDRLAVAERPHPDGERVAGHHRGGEATFDVMEVGRIAAAQRVQQRTTGEAVAAQSRAGSGAGSHRSQRTTDRCAAGCGRPTVGRRRPGRVRSGTSPRGRGRAPAGRSSGRTDRGRRPIRPRHG